MLIMGYIAAALIGISLGLIGGGGSILTVPVLVYLFGIHPALATSYSLFVVGTTSFVGAANNYHKGWISIKIALLFGVSSVLTVFLTRKYVIPRIPEHITSLWGMDITESLLTMVLFALLMVIASISMIRSRKGRQAAQASRKAEGAVRLFLYGVGIGIVTGLLGAGGGFLLIPTLVLLVGLPMKKAIGTSLMIIAMNSLVGFVGDAGHFSINWPFLLIITTIAVGGIFTGSILGKKIPGEKLKKSFGWFVLVIGLYIIIREIFLQ